MSAIDVTLPDVETTELMFDAVAQAVSGSESYSLTYAQTFAEGVLMAGGYISPAVAGNEGLFSSIGSGISAAWKWIKDTFARVWKFFFGKEVKEELEEAKADVEELEKAADTVSDKALEAVAEGETKADPDKGISDEDMKKAHALLASAEKIEETTAPTLVKVEEKVAQNVIQLDKALEAAKGQEDSGKEAATLEKMSASAKQLEKVLGEVNKALSNFSAKKKLSRNQVKQTTHQLSKVIAALTKHSNEISGFTSQIESTIKETETILSKADSNAAKQTKAKLDILKGIMTAGNTSAAVVKQGSNVIKVDFKAKANAGKKPAA